MSPAPSSSMPPPVPAPIPVPGEWASLTGSEPSAVDTLVAAALYLGRTQLSEIGALMTLARTAPVHHRGADGTPLLVALLRNWERQRVLPSAVPPTDSHVPRFPLPGEPAWDGQGRVAVSELAAATLIARGADPFAAAPDGTTAWELAHALGAPGLVNQMLRHPACPPPAQWPWVCVEDPATLMGKTLWPPLPAALLRHPSLVPVLLAAGAPLERAPSMGAPPAFIAQDAPVDGAAWAMALWDAGACPWSENENGWCLPEHWSLRDQGYRHPLLLDAWADHALKSLAQAPNAARRHRFIAAAFHLARPDWLERLSPPAQPGEWMDAPAPHGLNVMEWSVVGNVWRQNDEEVLAVMDAWLGSAPWPRTTHHAWSFARTLAKNDFASNAAAARAEEMASFERCVVAAKTPPLHGVQMLCLLREKTTLSPSDPYWTFAGNALARAWTSLLSKERQAWPLLDDLESLACMALEEQVGASVPIALWRTRVWACLPTSLSPQSPEMPDVGVPEPGWHDTADGLRLLAEWPLLAPGLPPASRRVLTPILENGQMARLLPPGQEASAPPVRL